MKKLYIFCHTDLDGMGVRIVATEYAKFIGEDFECHRCNYGDVNQIVMDTLMSADRDKISGVIIGDISVNEETAEYLNKLNKVHHIPVILRDHHATATWLNKYPWAVVTEQVDGVLRCGTWLLAEALNYESYGSSKVFVDTVDSWDTWKWKPEGNFDAQKLNALFQVLGDDDFTNYILTLPDPENLFNDYANAVIDCHNRQVKKTAANCVKHMTYANIETNNSAGKSCRFHTGIVFCNTDISDVADAILSEHRELDVLMLCSYPRTISLRTQKHLNMPLGDLAKVITGSGGGHPKSAGGTISHKKFKKLLKKSFEVMSDKKLHIDILEEKQ